MAMAVVMILAAARDAVRASATHHLLIHHRTERRHRPCSIRRKCLLVPLTGRRRRGQPLCPKSDIHGTHHERKKGCLYVHPPYTAACAGSPLHSTMAN